MSMCYILLDILSQRACAYISTVKLGNVTRVYVYICFMVLRG